MIKNKFYKNLYQAIFCFIGIMIPVSLVLGTLLLQEQPWNKDSWILFGMAFSLIFIYFLFGFCIIFQKVEISQKGIVIALFGKQLKNVTWEEVEFVYESNTMKNPTVTIQTASGEINLDDRKGIRAALLHFGGEKGKVIHKHPWQS